MRSRSVLYYTYKSSFSDFVSHDPINKSAVHLAACWFLSAADLRKNDATRMLYTCLFNIFYLNFHSSYLHISFLSKFLSALRSCYVNVRLHRTSLPNLVTIRIYYIDYIFTKYQRLYTERIVLLLLH